MTAHPHRQALIVEPLAGPPDYRAGRLITSSTQPTRYRVTFIARYNLTAPADPNTTAEPLRLHDARMHLSVLK